MQPHREEPILSVTVSEAFTPITPSERIKIFAEFHASGIPVQFRCLYWIDKLSRDYDELEAMITEAEQFDEIVQVHRVQEEHWLKIDHVFIQSALAELRTVRLPLVNTQRRFTTDGTFYSLYFQSRQFDAHFQWQNNPPDEWKPFMSVIHRLLDYARNAVIESQKGSL